MHLLGICVLLVVLLFSNLASDFSRSDDYYYDYDDQQERTDEPARDALPGPDMEQRLRSASSVDELMTLIYPSYWATLKCTSKLSSVAASSRSRSSGRQRPPDSTGDGTFSAAYLNLDVLKSIESEWRKTQCIPRCGGCCHSEDKQCRNISTGYLSKTLFEITVPITQGTKPVTISVANHTQCSCLSRLDFYKQVHSIIRRALPQCSAANSSCSPGETWNSRQCRCVGTATNARHSPSSPPRTSARPQQHQEMFSTDVCGPDKELDMETCQCVCQRNLPANSCAANQHLDPNTCQCVCSTLPASSCPPNHVFSKESCQCTCTRACPRHQPLNKTRCSCECNESPKKCFLKGKRFHRPTCSCVRPPCEVRRPRCDPGFSFSEEVCRCVPSHWRRID